MSAEPLALPELTADACGQTVLRGALRDLYEELDRGFRSWTTTSDGPVPDLSFPPLIAASSLHRLDYFRSFPHLVTLACALSPEDENLETFTQGEVLSERGELLLPRLSPTSGVLTPAACYHVYIALEGEHLAGAHVVTTRNTCFRREAHFEPLRRQASFGMREHVCIGSEAEVDAFLEGHQRAFRRFVDDLALPLELEAAQDPFFNPMANPKAIFQKIAPVKIEAVYGGDLAIASFNRHGTFFGETFGIRQASGAPAFSGCVAFGLERWVYAILHRFGKDRRDWPEALRKKWS